MVTGIYNLPIEVSSKVGHAITEFLQQTEDTKKEYSYEFKDFYSILSVDSKIMILECEASVNDDKLKYTAAGSLFSSEIDGIIIVSFSVSQIGLELRLLIAAVKEFPDSMVISISGSTI